MAAKRCFRCRITSVSGFRFSEHETFVEQAPELINALKQCCKAKELHFGKLLHHRVTEHGCESTTIVANILVEMYMRCGSIQAAIDTFQRMTHKTVVTWTCLIQGYVDNGLHCEALDVFDRMTSPPNHVTLLAALRGCSGLTKDKDCDLGKVLNKATAIHKLAESLHLTSINISITNTIIDVYSKCRGMALAKKTFDSMTLHRNVVTWTCLIRGYAENGEGHVALGLFSTMDCQPDQLTYLAALKACGEIGNEDGLIQGMNIHEEMKQRGFTGHIHLLTSLMEMYSRCGDMSCARDVFERMNYKDVAAWNCLITGYTQNGESMEALELFHVMDVHPSRVTYLAVLKSCMELVRRRPAEKDAVLAKAKGIQDQMDADDLVVGCSLVDLYSKCGSMPLARNVFDGLPTRDIATWTCLISGYVDNGESSTALELFARMDCDPNPVTYVALLKACTVISSTEDPGDVLRKGMEIHRDVKERGFESEILVATSLLVMYSSLRRMSLAREVFDGMVFKDAVAWNSLILGYVDNGESRTAVELFTRMDCQPSLATYIALLKACGALAEMRLGARLHGTLCKLGLEQDTTVASALLDVYAKCGCMGAAAHVFNSMHSPDVVSWSSLIAGYGSLGETSTSWVMSLAREMIGERGLKLDPVAFVCILAACSHTGMLEEGVRWFESMQRLGVSPGVEHYNCVVDMLGRAAKVDEAASLIDGMAFQGNQVTWRCLLSACTKVGDKMDVSTAAFENLKELNHRLAAFSRPTS